MSPEFRNRQLARVLGIVSILCPFLLVVIMLVLKTGLFTFSDDFTGFEGLGFFMGWGVILLPAGALAGIVALMSDRTSWLARIGAALNVSLFTSFLFMIVSLAF